MVETNAALVIRSRNETKEEKTKTPHHTPTVTATALALKCKHSFFVFGFRLESVRCIYVCAIRRIHWIIILCVRIIYFFSCVCLIRTFGFSHSHRTKMTQYTSNSFRWLIENSMKNCIRWYATKSVYTSIWLSSIWWFIVYFPKVCQKFTKLSECDWIHWFGNTVALFIFFFFFESDRPKLAALPLIFIAFQSINFAI